MGIQITDVIAVPEDFIIEEYMGMRERMGFFKYPDYITLDLISKTNAVIKTTGFLKVSLLSYAQNHMQERQAIASAAAYLMCLDELGLIVTSFKKFSFTELLWNGNKEEAFDVFMKEVVKQSSGMAVHMVNIFPLIQNSKFYLESAIQNLLRLDELELDRQETLASIDRID